MKNEIKEMSTISETSISICQCRRCKRHGVSSRVMKIPWRREWQPTPVFLPGESHGQRSLEGYGPWGRKESDTTEATAQCTAWRRLECNDCWLEAGRHSCRPAGSQGSNSVAWSLRWTCSTVDPGTEASSPAKGCGFARGSGASGSEGSLVLCPLPSLTCLWRPHWTSSGPVNPASPVDALLGGVGVG